MDRKTLLAITLCFLIFAGWQKYYVEPRQAALAPKQTATQTTGTAATVPVGQKAPTKEATVSQAKTPVKKPEQRFSIQTGTGVAQVSNGDRFFADWSLKDYRTGISKDAASIDLKTVTNQIEGEGELAFDLQDLAYLTDVQGTVAQVRGGVSWTYEDSNIKIVRTTASAEEQNWADVKIDVEFKAKRPNFAFISLYSKGTASDPEAKDRRLIYWTNKSMEHVEVAESIDTAQVATPVKWIGATNRYFLMGLIGAPGQLEPTALIQPMGAYSGRISMVYPVNGNALNLSFRAYFGPKELNALHSVEPTLDHTIDFGFFTFFAYPLLRLMKWLYDLFHNYGVAIIVLTLLVKIVTYPLTFKSMKSMREMAKLQPQMQRLRDKYANDKEALNREMMGLMKNHGYNPMAGCLPMLVQMPVFFALYNVLYSSIELYHAPFAFWIHDLSAKDPFYVTPILLTGVMFLQQKLQPTTATDPMQAKMLQFMPVIFGAFMLTLPSGLTIYMVINAVTTIIQQLIMNKKLGPYNPAPNLVKN